MRRYLLIIATITLALNTLTSCLNDNTEYTFYDDAAISSFTLGSLKGTFHALASDGSDSTYVEDVDCSGYTFNISHTPTWVENSLINIWCTDSLPVEVDLKHVICNISTRNSGVAVLRKLTDDTDTIYSSSDSIDFSQPRKFTVYNNSGLGKREYIVNLFQHKEHADSTTWTLLQENNTAFAGLSNIKMIPRNNDMLVIGAADGATKIYSSQLSNGQLWTEVPVKTTLDENVSKNIVAWNNSLFTIIDGKLSFSSNVIDWREFTGAPETKQLLGASKGRLYAVTADNKVVSFRLNKAGHDVETLDEGIENLPTENLTFVSYPSKSNADTDQIVLLGTRKSNLDANKDTTVVWTKTDEYGEGVRNNTWTLVETGATKKFYAPTASNLQAAVYDGTNIKLVTGAGLNNNGIKPFAKLYNSADGGMTWQEDTSMKLPTGIDTTTNGFAMTSDGVNSLWIICSGTGQVWKGRINRLAWKKAQDLFVE